MSTTVRAVSAQTSDRPLGQGAHAARRDELCSMPLSDRISHFARRDAYDMPDGTKLRMQPPARLPKLTSSALQRDATGTFRLTRPVVGLPCLGIPTAFYLHGRRDYLIGKSGRVHLTRCHRCPVKSLCERICEEVIHHSGDRVSAAYREFMAVGGWSAVVKRWASADNRGSAAAGRLRNLVRALATADLVFENDENVREDISRRREARRLYAAERQAKSRRHRATKETTSAPCPTPRSEAMADAIALRDRIEAAQTEGTCPRRLLKVNPSFAAKVYAIREFKKSRSQKHGPTHIARALTKAPAEAELEAMRKRVERALIAIKVFEGPT